MKRRWYDWSRHYSFAGWQDAPGVYTVGTGVFRRVVAFYPNV